MFYVIMAIVLTTAIFATDKFNEFTTTANYEELVKAKHMKHRNIEIVKEFINWSFN